MPPKQVETIRDEILYQYAKIIAKSAFGQSAKRLDFGFILKTFLELRDGTKKWSEITREDKQFLQTEKDCLYCGATENLQFDHVVPRSIRIKEACASCEKLQGIHNQIWACPRCNQEKGKSGLYAFFQKRLRGDKYYYDKIPSLLEKKYLKTIYSCHECAGTLSKNSFEGGRRVMAFDIDCV
ncbi:MAG: HNH endonuclease [Spirochaetia bacterium]